MRTTRTLMVIVGALLVTGCASTTTGAPTHSAGPDLTAPSSTIVSSSTEPTQVQPTGGAISSVPTTGPPGTVSDTDLPTIQRPTEGPKTPTDQITGLWELGTVSVGGPGPCYELVTDDGRELVLYSRQAGLLTAGDRIRVRILVPVDALYCGDVEAWMLVETKTAQ